VTRAVTVTVTVPHERTSRTHREWGTMRAGVDDRRKSHMRWLLLVIGTVHLCTGIAASSPSSFSVVSYLPEWRYEGANWDTICKYSTHVLLFSLEIGPGGQITALDRIPRAELMALARQAATRHDTALQICFGGNGRSGGFSAMVRNEAHRAAFIQNLVKLCDKYGFDGMCSCPNALACACRVVKGIAFRLHVRVHDCVWCVPSSCMRV